MDNNLLIKECKTKLGALGKKLDLIESRFQYEKVDLCERALMEIDISVREVKTSLAEYKFEDVAEEIYFFKVIKPQFISKFIYYSKLLSIEVAIPNAGKTVLKDYFEYELLTLKTFYDKYTDFYEYYRRKANFLDYKYFVRNQFDLKSKLETGLYDYDEKFATSHDHIVSQIIANDLLEKYLLTAINNIDGYAFKKVDDKTAISWSSSKSSLVELLYALFSSHVFNGGNIEFSEIVRSAEKALNVDLGNFYKTLNEIKNRKTNKTKFLQLLNENLNNVLSEED
ncbi:RteC domain-containing protein [Chryseobacterium sp. SIMBA_038]|uniref:RteC domain-containing protein n=1 Tax=Chryseobacterium sp. SIMBA_038 TaxID=3085780 RepID=UPI003979A7C4